MKRTARMLKYSDEFTHDGKAYYLPTVRKGVQNLPRQLFKVEDLDWLIPECGWTEEDEKRYPNFNRPIFVVMWKGKKCCIDGYHRIYKAKRKGIKHLVGIWVPDNI